MYINFQYFLPNQFLSLAERQRVWDSQRHCRTLDYMLLKEMVKWSI